MVEGEEYGLISLGYEIWPFRVTSVLKGQICDLTERRDCLRQLETKLFTGKAAFLAVERSE